MHSDRIKVAVAFHNGLHDADWPNCSSMRELAKQTRMMLGTLDLFGLKSRSAWEHVIFTALSSAFDAGFALGDMKAPTDEEMAEAERDPSFQSAIANVQDKVALFLERWKLRDALLRVSGSKCCVNRAWRVNGYVRIAMTCLACGRHQLSYPDLDIAQRAFDDLWPSFLTLHGACT